MSLQRCSLLPVSLTCTQYMYPQLPQILVRAGSFKNKKNRENYLVLNLEKVLSE